MNSCPHSPFLVLSTLWAPTRRSEDVLEEIEFKSKCNIWRLGDSENCEVSQLGLLIETWRKVVCTQNGTSEPSIFKLVACHSRRTHFL